ncbi:competence type IV pilus minor pilin ComGF [Candidatus Enterococcus mansonii]|uniref:Prepilin-type N-terminal cleavage/methylation domain-containing protein n=1 Tax=Candidatus Enterococcus mansonii TaxID=1834181 RepID=A0A242CHY5_9ENTE|nr:competence type IV pilus minor pilin ComGF [Enterococcus sp. 4G2_DIV0659]OTO09854.1 hypothetical protein A5880_000537 [Enterococcus sp. 4G2_DIV0659]
MGKKRLLLKRNKNNYSGFTLFECLLALLLLSTICLLFSSSLKAVATVTSQLKDQRVKEWQIFLIQLENELKDCYYETTQTNKMILKNKRNKASIWIEYKLGKIVKVENGGFQPLLTEVKQANFTEENKAVRINVTFDSGVEVTAKWIITQEHQNEK